MGSSFGYLKLNQNWVWFLEWELESNSKLDSILEPIFFERKNGLAIKR